MYNEFSITGVIHNFSEKNIILETNFKLDESSVNMNTVKVRNGNTGATENYTLSVDKKNIIITFVDYPIPNVRYLISVTDIKDVLDRGLKQYLDRTLIFKSTEVKHKVTILEPKNGEALENNIITIKVKATPEDEPVNGYYYEIASDVAFCDIFGKISSTSPEASFTDIPTGQCFVRCRVQDEKDSSIFGDWSESIAFIAMNKGCIDDDPNNNDTTEQEDENPIIEDLLSLQEILMDDTPLKLDRLIENGKTSNYLTLVFNKELDPTSIPEMVVSYRRDL